MSGATGARPGAESDGDSRAARPHPPGPGSYRFSVFLFAYNLEVLGQERPPLLRVRVKLIEERAIGTAELVGMLVVVAEDFAFEEFPQPLDDIRVGRVWRQKMRSMREPSRYSSTPLGPVVPDVVARKTFVMSPSSCPQRSQSARRVTATRGPVHPATYLLTLNLD